MFCVTLVFDHCSHSPQFLAGAYIHTEVLNHRTMSVIRHTANQIALHDRLHSGTCITIKAKVCCVTLVTPLPATPTSLPPVIIHVVNAPRPSPFSSASRFYGQC